MNVGIGGRELRRDAAQACAIEADAFRCRRRPAIVEGGRTSAGEIALADGQFLGLRGSSGCREHEESGKAEAPQSFATLAHAAISIPLCYAGGGTEIFTDGRSSIF